MNPSGPENTERLLHEFDAMRNSLAETGALAMLFSLDGQILNANEVAATVFQRRVDELKGFAPGVDLRLECIQVWREMAQDVRRTSRTARREIRMGERLFDVVFSPCRNAEGEVIGATVLGWDISGHANLESRLAGECTRYRTLFETANDAIHILDERGDLVEANAAFYQMLGYPTANPPKLNVSDWDTERSREALQSSVRHHMAYPEVFETRHRRNDGSFLDIEINARGFEWEGKRYLFASARDITQRKASEAALHRAAAAKEKLRGAIVSINSCADRVGALKCVLEHAIELSGMDAGASYEISGDLAIVRHEIGLEPEFIAKVAERPLSTPYVKKVMAQPQKLISLTEESPEHAGLSETYGLRHIYCIGLAAHGRTFGYLIVVSRQENPPSTSDLQMIRLLAVETESMFRRLAAEEEKARLSAEQRIILETIPLGVALVRDGLIQWTNPTYDDIIGYERGTSVGLRREDFYASKEEAERVLREGYPQLAAGSIYTTETKARRKDGSEFWCRIFGQATNLVAPMSGAIWIVEDTTERRRAEAALRLSETRYDALVRSLPVGVYLIRAKSGGGIAFEYVSPRAAELIGSSVESMMANPEVAFDRAYEDDRVNLREASSLAVARREPFEWEGRFFVDGEIRWLQMASDPSPQPDGDCLWNGVIRDVTESRRAQQRLAESEASYRNQFANNQVVMLMVDPVDGAIVDANRAAARFYGYTRDQMRKMRVTDINTLPASEVARSMNSVEGLQAERFQFQHRLADGSIRDVEVTSSRINFAGREILHSIVHDVTERRHAEEKVAESLAMLEGILESTAEGILLTGVGRKMLKANRKFFEMWRIPPELVAHGTNEERLQYVASQSVDPEQFLARIHELNANPDLAGFDSIVLKDGRILERYSQAQQLGGRELGRLWSFRDITERMRTQQALEESKARLNFTLENTGVGHWSMDLSTGLVTGTTQNNRIFGFEKPGLVRRYSELLATIVHPDDRAFVDGIVRPAVAEGRGFEFECRIVRADHGVRWIWIKGAVAESAEPGPKRVLGIVMDVTSRRQLEERLRQSQKMEGIGHLAGGMAHEFNNILAALLLNLNIGQTSESVSEMHDTFHDMEGLCERAAELIRNLIAFSRQSVMRMRPMDLGSVVVVQAEMLARLFGESIRVAYPHATGTYWVNADKGMMEQVVLNLCLNARDAMKEGGVIELGLAELEITSEQALEHDDARPGQYVCLSVADTGCGMDERTKARLFEPFFTTKDVGHGTGLGLATVRGIVGQHRGWVEVESELNRGSTFRIYLPAVSPAGTATRPALASGGASVQGTILVVEDEPTVRRTTRTLLSRAGYTVLEAKDGGEALSLWEQNRGKVDLLFTDMVMGSDLNGLDLAQRLQVEKPGLKVIITSGYATDLRELSKFAEAGIIFLGKPFPAPTLLATIEKCLALPPAP